MQTSLHDLYKEAIKHQKQHDCGAVPYEQADKLKELIEKNNTQRMLEIGTGIGYTAAYMSYTNPNAIIHTIDKDAHHLQLAKENWEEMNCHNITAFLGKAHEVISAFTDQYDMIFFDAYTPQRKFFTDFERLLKPHGLLVTANLFLNNPSGGKYLEILKDTKRWNTSIVGDTAISLKTA